MDCEVLLVNLPRLTIGCVTSATMKGEGSDCVDDAVEEDHVKWVVLMVLFNQPEHEEAYARMEDLVFQDYAEALH